MIPAPGRRFCPPSDSSRRPPPPPTSLCFAPGAPAAPQLTERVEQGAFVIVEGASTAAEFFGFRAGKDHVVVGSVEDVHRPKLPIIWQKAVELPRFEVPKAARIFAKERWTGAPLIAGYTQRPRRVSCGWPPIPASAATSASRTSCKRSTISACNAPFRSARLWAFFDSAYRMRVDLDYFAARWRASGIAALQVAAWHYYDPDPERDRYLKSLIEACHRHGILVYAWIELPHVSGQFWKAHPEWREKTALSAGRAARLAQAHEPDQSRLLSRGVSGNKGSD